MIIFFVFILGFCVGSFLNVVIDRLPKNESIIKGRSYCDSCGKKLLWYDMAPILSFFFLRGKCRFCHKKISIQYPLVEFLTGILFVLTTFFVVNNFQFSIFNSQSILNSLILNSLSLIILLYYLFIVSSLVVIFFTDLKYGVIPDKVVFPGILISLVYLFLIHNSLLPIRFIASAGAFLFLLFLHLITRGRGMGMGDVKFSFLMGLFLGFPKIVSAFYIAFLTGAVFSLILVLWRKKKFRGTTIPFGPFLVFGTLTAFFLGEKFIITGVLNQLTALF